MNLPTEEQSSASEERRLRLTDFKFALPEWPYEFWDLPPVAEAAFDSFIEDRFITTKMLTVSPMSPYTDLTHFEKRVYEEIASYEEATGGPLRCDGYASRGKKGLGRLEAHLIFPKTPNMAILKRLMRKIGSVVVTGDYSPAEDWTNLAPELLNHPPHNGCLHYVAQHAEHPDARRIWNNPGRKTVARAKRAKRKQVSREQRDAKLQRELDDAVWLGQNKQPPKTGALREVRGHIMRELPRYVSKPAPMMLTAAEAEPRRRELAAGKRREMSNGQVVMTLPRSDSARTSRTT